VESGNTGKGLYIRILFSLKKDGNCVICESIDEEPGGNNDK
jgi:hypothetical protein